MNDDPIKILVLEDEPDTAEMIAEMMRISGMECEYDSSTTALDHLKQNDQLCDHGCDDAGLICLEFYAEYVGVRISSTPGYVVSPSA